MLRRKIKMFLRKWYITLILKRIYVGNRWGMVPNVDETVCDECQKIVLRGNIIPCYVSFGRGFYDIHVYICKKCFKKVGHYA